MRMNPYLSFNGQCEAAFKLYEQCLGGQLGPIFRYAGTPLSDQVPADWQDKVMHGSLTIGGQVVMGGDVAPESYEAPKGFSLSLQMKSTGRGRADLQRAQQGWPGNAAAREDILGRALWHGRRSVRDTVVDQLRRL